MIIGLLVAGAAQAQQQVYPSELTVAQDGSGNYRTIQEAVNSVRDLGQKRVVIHIKKGTYHEKLVIPSWKTNISLVGDAPENTIITNNDYSGKAVPGGTDAYGRSQMTTYTSHTVLVQGAGIIIENLTIENTAGRVGQAVALHVEGDRTIIRNCRLLGNQDTLYATNGNSRQYYDHCYIEGTTDFIFGAATAVFNGCTIRSLTPSFITAASTLQGQPFGFVFMKCKLVADTSVKKALLGRPWRPYARTVFMNCQIGAHIAPAGWNSWPGDAMFPNKELTAFYAEYKNTGPGANTSQRVAWSKELTDKEAKAYTIKNILGGADDWQPEARQ